MTRYFQKVPERSKFCNISSKHPLKLIYSALGRIQKSPNDQDEKNKNVESLIHYWPPYNENWALRCPQPISFNFSSSPISEF
jgi:hypothetical protein